MHPVLTHLALHVHDLDACIVFYREFCGMHVVHERSDGGRRVVWRAEPGREQEFIFVMVPGGIGQQQAATDYSHLGFALESRAAVDALADRARQLTMALGDPGFTGFDRGGAPTFEVTTPIEPGSIRISFTRVVSYSSGE